MALLDQFEHPLPPVSTSRMTARASRDAGAYRGSISGWRGPQVHSPEGESRERDVMQRRAADLVGVEHFLEVRKAVLEQQIRELRLGALCQHFLQLAAHQLCRALDALKHDVAAVAVGDDHIAAARERGVGLDVADEVQTASAQETNHAAQP